MKEYIKAYMNTDTGIIFTIEELKTLWKQFKNEMDFDTLEDFLSSEKLSEIIVPASDID